MKLIDYLEKQVQSSTAKSYGNHIENYLKANKNAHKYDYAKVMQHIELLRKQYQVGTIQIIIASLKKYYDYLIEIGKRKDNPVNAIKLRDNQEKPIQLQDLLTQKELETLLVPRKERYPFLAKRNQIVMSLLVHQALRVGELEKLKILDVDLEKATIQITGTGLTNTRNLPLNASQILLFHQYIQHDRKQLTTWRDNQNALLLGKLGTPIRTEDINYLVATYKSGYNKKITATLIRQSVIANLLTKNNDLRVVQHFAGHKSPDTTEKYRQTGLNELKKALNSLHPIR